MEKLTTRPIVYSSKCNWKPGMSGVEIGFSEGEIANYRAKDGVAYKVRIESELMAHNSAIGEYVREVQTFKDWPYGPEKVAVPAAQLEPIFK